MTLACPDPVPALFLSLCFAVPDHPTAVKLSYPTVTASHPNLPPEPDLNYGQLLQVLLRRWVWFAGTLGSVLLLTGLLTIFGRPTYESSMRLLVEPNYPEGANGTNLTPSRTDREIEMGYATQLNLMRSYELVQKAVANLSSEYPDLKVKQILKRLALEQVEEEQTGTKIFEVVYEADDPTQTRRLLESLQQVYQTYNLEQQQLRLSQGLQLINQQLQGVHQSISQTQTALDQFRQQQNLIDPTRQANAISDSLNTLEEEQQSLDADYREAQARYTLLQQQLALNPLQALIASRLSQSTRFQSLLDELQKTELELAEQQTLFTDAAPRVQLLLDRRQSNLALLRQEVERVLGQTPTALKRGDAPLLQSGQLGDVDLDLVSELVKVQSDLVGLQARGQSLARSQRTLRAELNRFPNLIAEYDRLQPQVEINRTVLQELLAERQKLTAALAQGGFNWQMVESPLDGKKISPDPVQNLLLGTIAGIFLGGLVAFLREVADTVIHRTDSLKKAANLPLLGILPEIRSKQRAANSASGPALSQPTVPDLLQLVQDPYLRESFDLTYKNIQLTSQTNSFKSLAVTSSIPAEGKSTVVLGLAMSAARLHQKVLILEANFRNSSLQDQFQLAAPQGLADLLQDQTSLLHPLQLSFDDFAIDLLPAGAEPVDPVRLLSSQRMKDVVAACGAVYDLVLLDSPCVLGLVDAVQIASVCDGVVLVGRLDHLTEPNLTEAIALLNPFNVMGMIANRSKQEQRHYAFPESRAINPEVQTLPPISFRTDHSSNPRVTSLNHAQSERDR